MISHSFSVLKRNALILSLLICFSCNNQEKKADSQMQTSEVSTSENMDASSEPFFKLSLAQWSINKDIREGRIDPFDFADKAKAWGFDGIEYVSQLYSKELEKYASIDEGMANLVKKLKDASNKAGIKNLVIMVDGEGDLADPDEKARIQAVDNHKKWVDAAAAIGCHSIRVNTFGTNDREEWKVTVSDGLKRLSEYAATKNINVLVENHGWLSSDPELVMEVINALDMDNCGTLPDFGNWCIKRKEGEKWGECLETYPDKYKGIELMMPAAKAVSAKSYKFDKDGNETTIDYYKMIQIVKDSGYDGYIGVEYEGDSPEEEGIKATRDLLLKAAAKTN